MNGNLICIGPCIILITDEKYPTRCHLLLYYADVRLHMFRTLLCPPSGAHADSVSYHIGLLVLELLLDGSLSAGRIDEFPDRRCVTAFGPETHPSCLHLSFHPTATREPEGLCGN